MDARSIVSRFSDMIAKSPIFIYSTALPLSFSTNSASRQIISLFSSPMRLGNPRINHDVNEEHIVLRTDTQPSQLDDYFSAIFSADSRYVISGGISSVCIWNVHTGEKIRELVGHSEHIYCLATSPTGDIVASGSVDRTIRLWNTETGAPIGEPLQGHGDTVRSVSFSPDGQNIASGSDDRTVRIWSVKTGRAIGNPLTGHDHFVERVAYSPDGKQLASGDENGRIIIWDVETCKRAVAIEISGSPVFSLAFSPNGKLLASASNDGVRIWDVSTGEIAGEPYPGHEKDVNSVCFSPDSSRIISGSRDKTVRIWSLETREEVMPPLQHGGPVYSVAYSQDGSRIMSASVNCITIWNSLTGKPIISTDSNFERIAKDGSNLIFNDCQLFEGWKVNGGWLVGASGEYRLLLPPYMRKLVRQVDEGVYVHQDLHLNLCNATAKDFEGFVFTS